MPDTLRYTSVSVSNKAHADLTRLQEMLLKQHDVKFSIAKVIEKLCADAVKQGDRDVIQ
tara:strand:+ start:126 stop:302 length:177 start_codon:yes stop_codon:yes gene_type:complete